MSKSVRIRTAPDGSDKYVKVQLDQDFDFIEILSLKISQEEAYRRFCSDYGVIVGRVNVNNGFGVPNAKVSVFIPIDELDLEDPEIAGLYPYEIITDTDADGIRYNLLPRTAKGRDECYTPVGTFPNKREFIDNDEYLEVYEKYYKFTTTTNEAGDFMIFGVPVGNHTLHVEADLSDIGDLSQRPYDFIREGADPKAFQSPTKFKNEGNINTLRQIKFKSPIGVNVRPFWGDTEQCRIGITRSDVDLGYNVRPHAIFMGSIFSDNEKNSVNKNCGVRKDLGRQEDLVTGEGTIEMIRKTPQGNVERYDVEGGRVITDTGAWAYQIPMNLDYVVTDEFGNIVATDDPNKGIPTRARVRFRVGMDVTGGEGRLRTRAKYLIPHNPASADDADYTFGQDTKDEHFADLYWNKIYSVKNFITRFQGIAGDDVRRMTGFKDVDEDGGKAPIPYNRIDTDINPLFTILCIILSIIVSLITVINGVLIPAINFVISAINIVLEGLDAIFTAIGNFLCPIITTISNTLGTIASVLPGVSFSKLSSDDCKDKFSGVFNPIGFIKCITLNCDGGNGDESYAPGCGGNSKGWEALNDAGETPDHYAGLFGQNNCGHDGHNTPGAGYTDCQAIKLADALDMFEFDFYNDWINGSLYLYLIKYKKKGNGKEKWCEYECDEFSGGFDGNGDGNADNKCDQSYLWDTCVGTSPTTTFKDSSNKSVRCGLVKRVEEDLGIGQPIVHFYYAPITPTSTGNYRLFATDIIHLGSVFDCDWQGIPKLHDLVPSTTYQRPPFTADYNEADTKVICGITSTGSNGGGTGMFFDINCLGLFAEDNACSNVKRVCEYGVGLEFQDPTEDYISDVCVIGNNHISDGAGQFFRNSFYTLNINGVEQTSFNYPAANTTDFTNSNYSTFRRFSSTSYSQPLGNSFYFYFGLVPGATAVELMNRKYFTDCIPVKESDFVVTSVVTNVTTVGGSDGTIQLDIVGGSPDYTYTVTTTATPIVSGTIVGTTETFTNLAAGTYTFNIQDSDGFTEEVTIVVNAPQPLTCTVSAVNAATPTADGSIIIDVIGGTPSPNYSYTIRQNNATGTILYGPTNFQGGATVTVPFDNVNDYYVEITDGTDTCNDTVTVLGPQPLSLTVTGTDETCENSNNGTITISVSDGTPPYSITTTAPNGYVNSSTNLSSLTPQTYTIDIIDSAGDTLQATQVIGAGSRPTISDNGSFGCYTNTSTTGQADSTSIRVKIDNYSASLAPYTMTLTNGGTSYGPYNNSGNQFVQNFTGNALPAGSYTVKVTDSNGCFREININTAPGGIAPGIALDGTATQTITTAAGTQQGQIKAEPLAGSGHGGYSYRWFKNGAITTYATATLNLSAGQYNSQWKCRITDAKGCQAFTNELTIT